MSILYRFSVRIARSMSNICDKVLGYLMTFQVAVAINLTMWLDTTKLHNRGRGLNQIEPRSKEC